MNMIISAKYNFYMQIVHGEQQEIARRLADDGIYILTGFIKNIDLVNDFYKTYYYKNNNRIVLYSINPGRFGSGKTGVPLLDYKSLSYLLPEKRIKENDSELSA